MRHLTLTHQNQQVFEFPTRNRRPSGEKHQETASHAGASLTGGTRAAWLCLITPMLCAKCGVDRMPGSQYAKPNEESVQQHVVPHVLGTSQTHCNTLSSADGKRLANHSGVFAKSFVTSSRNARCVAIVRYTHVKCGVE